MIRKGGSLKPSGPYLLELIPVSISIKPLGIFLLPPKWDASPSQGTPQHEIRRYPFIHLGGEGHCESKVSCPRTQHNFPGQGLNPDLSIRRQARYSWGHRASQLLVHVQQLISIWKVSQEDSFWNEGNEKSIHELLTGTFYLDKG